MKQTVNFCDFCDAFTGGYKDNFSYLGKQALYDYLESYEESTGEELELDPIALCCEYTEYESLEELKDNYSDINSIEELVERTIVIPIEGTSMFIIQDF